MLNKTGNRGNTIANIIGNGIAADKKRCRFCWRTFDRKARRGAIQGFCCNKHRTFEYAFRWIKDHRNSLRENVFTRKAISKADREESVRLSISGPRSYF